MFPYRVQCLSPSLNCLRKTSGFFFAFASYTKAITNSVNQCVLSFEKGLEMKFLDAFLM